MYYCYLQHTIHIPVVLFAIGGYAYSVGVNPWPWLTSQAAAEAMADEVATWLSKYGIDGIDMDIEEGAGGQGNNLIALQFACPNTQFKKLIFGLKVVRIYFHATL